MEMKTKQQWYDLAKEIDSSFTVDMSSMPEQDYTAQEYRGWATDAGATWNEELAPLDELVGQYGG